MCLAVLAALNLVRVGEVAIQRWSFPAGSGDTLKPHYHAGIEHILLYTFSAIVGINILGLIAAKMATADGGVGTIGRALGAVVPFKVGG